MPANSSYRQQLSFIDTGCVFVYENKRETDTQLEIQMSLDLLTLYIVVESKYVCYYCTLLYIVVHTVRLQYILGRALFSLDLRS